MQLPKYMRISQVADPICIPLTADLTVIPKVPALPYECHQKSVCERIRNSPLTSGPWKKEGW